MVYEIEHGEFHTDWQGATLFPQNIRAHRWFVGVLPHAWVGGGVCGWRSCSEINVFVVQCEGPVRRRNVLQVRLRRRFR